MNGRSYRDLEVWQKAMDLVTDIYSTTNSFPDTEKFGLTNQLRRAAVSIPSNIAEGQGRGSKKEFNQFLNIAYGSLQEVETQIEISTRLNFISNEQSTPLLDQCSTIARMLNGLKRSLRCLLYTSPSPRDRG